MHDSAGAKPPSSGVPSPSSRAVLAQRSPHTWPLAFTFLDIPFMAYWTRPPRSYEQTSSGRGPLSAQGG